MAGKKKLSFEQALDALNTTVAAMESGELSLEQSLAAFEKGIGLIKDCQASLDAAEQKVQQLIETQQGFDTSDFTLDE
ncbi:MAG: exodeoxyribonuclease VII small subunit [Pseudomonadales bacterium]|nr:exodeoxyribonuclease VII small subunit [Pseudomonadales bacterium]